MVAAPADVRSQKSSNNIVKTMRVLLPEKLSDEGIALLREQYEVKTDYNITPERLLKDIVDYDAIIVRSGTTMTGEVIRAAKNLKVIGRAGVGVDNIDLSAATERGVLVVNAPTGNCVAAAEHTVALMCSLARLVSQADAEMKQGGWGRSKFVGVSLSNKVLGVVGFGRIGREVAKRAIGLGMRVVVHDPYISEEIAAALGVEALSLDQTLERAHFLTLHLPLLDSTKGLINKDAFRKMKEGVRIVNAARGGIVVEADLLEALESGKVASAALDCFESEPPYKYPDSVSNKLVNHSCVLATPHLGASTREAQEDVAVEVANAVRSALQGDLVPTMVNAPPISPEILVEMKPRAILAERLGRLSHVLSGGNVSGEVTVTYHLNKPDEDTRLLRAAVIKGLMEPGLDITINIVNAEAVAKQYGLKITEVIKVVDPGHMSDNEVSLNVKGAPEVHGRVTASHPHVSRIGRFELDLRLEGIILAYSQDDRPGQIGRIGTLLGKNDINISFMTLARDPASAKALVLLGLDQEPSEVIRNQVFELIGDKELLPTLFKF